MSGATYNKDQVMSKDQVIDNVVNVYLERTQDTSEITYGNLHEKISNALIAGTSEEALDEVIKLVEPRPDSDE